MKTVTLGAVKKQPRARSIQEQNDRARVSGGRLRTDLYHFILRASWQRVLLAYVALYLAINALFAAGYVLTGGVANARPGSWVDGFWFSVQILGTGGDGGMSAASTGAHLLVTAETMLGILLIAFAGGVTVAKFSVSTARVRFSTNAVLFLFDGVPALAFRIGNEQRELVAGVEVSLVATTPERTAEGFHYWRTHELRLRRARIPALTRGFIVMHLLDAESPLHGATPERLAAEQWEFEAVLLGTDTISGQAVHASHTWEPTDLRWGHRLADTFTPLPEGGTLLDLRNFDETVPCAPTAEFPYPRPGP